ncbi:MAG: septal ring lytic transglycosylase RlpA family lipoprotein [Gammaproteobacteria bacterium]|nr:MAG: septal ring lytic transglycosylase RlpA family lipoprotein [Gammaproteobacteria bacterium]
MEGVIKKLTIVGLCSLLLACGSVTKKQDSAPKRAADVSSVQNAIPKDEPKSKYGNPAHYEVFGKRYYTLKTSRGYHEKGIASWYGTKFHGRRTSSGEVYDMYAMTAAHKTLPLPTYVEVTNLDNGRKVIVKVNDRGPFHGNRLIDLSYSAATKLGIIGKGTGNVDIRAVSVGDTAISSPAKVSYSPIQNTAGLYLQLGAFATLNRAEQLRRDIQQEVSDTVLIVPLLKADMKLYRVRIGPLVNVEYGDSLAQQLVELGFKDTHIVIE